MGIVMDVNNMIDWEETMETTWLEIRDYDDVELSELEWNKLCNKVESELDGYIDIETSNVEGIINRYLIEVGYQYDDKNCVWYK